MAKQQTATELYDERREDIARVLDWIAIELDKHHTNTKANPNNWGFAGELGTVREKLIETLASISQFETHEIENLLSECR